jgi:hypothetical protein
MRFPPATSRAVRGLCTTLAGRGRPWADLFRRWLVRVGCSQGEWLALFCGLLFLIGSFIWLTGHNWGNCQQQSDNYQTSQRHDVPSSVSIVSIFAVGHVGAYSNHTANSAVHAAIFSPVLFLKSIKIIDLAMAVYGSRPISQSLNVFFA